MVDVLEQYISKLRVPLQSDRVYKDECVYSFDTPESEDGLYICMNSYVGLGRKHIFRYYKNTGHSVYLNLKRRRKEIKKLSIDDSPPTKKPTRLAIGLEGGFDLDEKQFEFDETTSLLIMPDFIELPCRDLPLEISLVVAGIMAADDPLKREELAATAGTWDGEKRVISQYSENLEQLNNGKRIPPSGWKCEKCDLTSNLWLNLTDGSILCGRRFFDGSGGNNHALEHYSDVKYPLAVKLGTISDKGADVFSYVEDDMVEDPHLERHLLHWGINVAAMTKTEKTMSELEVDLNQKIGEWDVIQEHGSVLVPLFGPGHTGIRNLGNSCYMNSVLQVLFTLPEFQQKYYEERNAIFDRVSNDPTNDFNVQMAKIGHGLCSGDYSQQPKESIDTKLQKPLGIRPQMFKSIVGRGHPEFSTKCQQDALEFLLHLSSLIEKNSRGSVNPCTSFQFTVEDRLECKSSGKVRYSKRNEYSLSLPIPLHAVTNTQDVLAYESKKISLEQKGLKIDPSEIVRPKIPLYACLEAFASTQVLEDFYSTAVQHKTTADLCSRLSTFPDYLFIHLKKFTLGDDWVPRKHDVAVDVPDVLDLAFLRSKGFQPDTEEQMPEDMEQEVGINDELVNQLVDTGFPFNACRKAVYHTGNSGLEVAMEWLMSHVSDPDFADPLVLNRVKDPANAPPEDSVAMIEAMGFSRPQALKALRSTDNNVERAADWIFSHLDELDEAPDESAAGQSADRTSALKDGVEKYRLKGFISHMGTSTMVGHYVCHIRKDDQWVICNDEKIAVSEHPPRELAYIYLYERIRD